MRLAHPFSLLLVAGAAATMACGSCSGGAPLEVAAVPTTAVVGCQASVQVVVDGGVAPYAFALRSGPGAVDAVTGRYTVPPRPGAAVVRVTDAAGATRDVTLTIALPAASTWLTVDDHLTPAGTQAGLVGLSSSADGTLFALGFGGSGWMVRRGTDAGSRWETVDTYPPPGTFASPGAITTIGTTEVYVGGEALSGGVATRPCVVRRSLDTGQSWETLELLAPDGPGSCTVRALAPGPDGGLLAGCHLDPGDGGPLTWVVRASGDRGASWSTLDVFQALPDGGGPSAGASPTAIAVGADGTLHVAGGGTEHGRNHWYVRALAPGSAAWTLEDDFTLPDPGDWGTFATAAAADPTGPVYVAGPAGDARGRTRWALRGRLDGGWTTLDEFVDPPDAGVFFGQPRALAVDGAGAPYVVGRLMPSARVGRWLVRAPDRAAGGFTTVDDFAYPDASTSEANAVAVTPAGEHLVGGVAWFTTAPGSRWLVRKEVPVCP